MEDGSTVLGNVEIKERSLVVSVNSAARAERAIAMLRPCPRRAGGAAATEIQTIDQMLGRQQDRPWPASDIPVEIQIRLVHEFLHRQYRALLDQPVPMLGDVTPRRAARTAAGREKLAVWLKHLENRSRQQPDPADPIATYHFAWLWRELKVENLRR